MNILSQVLEPDGQAKSLSLIHVCHCLGQALPQLLLQSAITFISWLKIPVGWVWRPAMDLLSVMHIQVIGQQTQQTHYYIQPLNLSF
jgi:hypothetical protein